MSLETRVVHRRDEWNALVSGMPHPDFRQCWQWGAVRATRGWDVIRVAVMDGDACPAAAQVLVRRVPGLGVVLYAPRGPLVADHDGAWEALPRLLAHLRAATGGLFLRVSPGAALEDGAAVAPLAARGFVELPDLWSFWATPRNVMRLDLTGTEREVLGRMSRKRRQHVSTGARKGITTELATGLAALRTFHGLHGTHARRERYPAPPWPTLEAFHREFAPGDGLVVVSGRVRGELAGMLIGLRFGPVAHTLYTASTPAAHHAPVGDLLHWELMRWARDAGCRDLDLGSSCTDLPPTETHPNYGIYRFKYELGARLILSAPYHDHVWAPLRYRVARQLELRALPIGHQLLGRLRPPARARGRAAIPRGAPVEQAS
jgi:lipid II:glycine glycyltransferase (peptidoglycan interpeptide bridge formation enzyme)